MKQLDRITIGLGGNGRETLYPWYVSQGWHNRGVDGIGKGY